MRRCCFTALYGRIISQSSIIINKTFSTASALQRNARSTGKMLLPNVNLSEALRTIRVVAGRANND
jgi:hypothetical protein